MYFLISAIQAFWPAAVIELVTIAPQPTAWVPTEHPVIPNETAIEALAIAQPQNHTFVDGFPALGKVCAQEFRAHPHDRQRVFNFVCNPRREPAHGFHFLRLDQLQLDTAELRVRRLEIAKRALQILLRLA